VAPEPLVLADRCDLAGDVRLELDLDAAAHVRELIVTAGTPSVLGVTKAH